MLRHCKIVDEVIENPPLVITKDFIQNNSIDLVVHADDSKQEVFFKIPIELGIMKYVPYTVIFQLQKL